MSRSARTSKFPLLTVPDALSVIFREIKLLKPEHLAVFAPGATANHPVLAQDVFAKVRGPFCVGFAVFPAINFNSLYLQDPLPPYRASMVDGYAVVCADGAGKVIVLHSLPATRFLCVIVAVSDSSPLLLI